MKSFSINESDAELLSPDESTLFDLRADRSLLVYFAVALSTVGVVIADFQTKLGLAVWILYVVPICLAMLSWNVWLPATVAGVCSAFMAVNFQTDLGAISVDIARFNRVVGSIVLWALAFVGFFFIQNKISVRREEWLQKGQTALHEVMAGQQDIGELGRDMLRFLSNYLGASVAVMYVRQGEGFIRLATYGLAKSATAPERIEPGDGLLWQASVDKHTFALREVSDDYLVYGSAFGAARPKNLLIAPAVYAGSTSALIELGFADHLGETPAALLKRVSEALAVTVRSAEYQQRLQMLLDQTRQQAEELRRQEEELRSSNEELEQQSRALLKSQAELEQQQSEVEQTNAQLEEQTSRLELQKDELEEAKSQLQLRARELEQASRYKSDFLANMSHELRTPLNSTLILAKLLADNAENNLTEEQVRYAETIQSSGNDLLNLINDILDLSKIEAGHMQIEARPFSLRKLRDNLHRVFEPLAQTKQLSFHCELDEGCPPTLESDRQRLEQILKNLLSNAIKFTERGEVRMAVRRAAGGRVAFAVSDTGIGISDENQAMIFDAFQQADGTTSRKFGGTGLGLSISRELTRLLGGEIHLESTPGKGSTFTVILPELYSADAVQPRPMPATAASHRLAPRSKAIESRETERTASVTRRSGPLEDDRDKLTGTKPVILVIEDDLPFARILFEMVHELNFECLVESTAEEGLAACREYSPTAIVLDVGLPDQSGLTVLDRIKQSVHTRHIPVHIISVADHTHTALSLGAMGYMLKPVQREQVTQALKHMEKRFARHIKRLLIVEDDAAQREGLEKLLAAPGVEIVAVGTAQDCLARLRGETFDCMVLDLNLPDGRGYHLLQTLSEEDAYSFPPVIVYTGQDISPKEEQALSRYSKSIIIKGAKSPERLIDEVTLFLHQVVADLPKSQQNMLQKAKNRDALLEGRRILVVEDDVRNVYALTSVLEPRGVQVEIARNGREALERLDGKEADEAHIDLVLMDVMMPEMDGLTATAKIREMAEYRHLPIIMLTAKAMKGDHRRCLEAGANDYMAKPLDADKLLSLIRVWMPR